MAKVAMDLERVREAMREHNLDGLLFTNEDNIFWATGKPPKPAPEGDKPCYVVISADPSVEPAIIIDEYSSLMMKVKGFPISDMRTYKAWQEVQTVEDIRNGTAKREPKPAQHDHSVSQQLLKDLLKDKGMQNGRVGIENGVLMTIPYFMFSLIKENNPDITFVDVSQMIWDLRAVKTEDEIEAHRDSYKLAIKGLWGMLSGRIIGSSMQELQRRFRDSVLRELPDSQLMGMEWRHQMICSGDPWVSRFSPEYRVKEGDLVFWDGGLKLNGYNSDFGRLFSAGKAGSLEVQLYDALRAGQEAGLAMIKPGNKFSDVWKVMHEEMWKRGFEWFYRGCTGHCIGLGQLGEQPPFIAENDHSIIKPNMVICCENAGLYVKGLASYSLEDTVVVREDGLEFLTPLTRDLAEVA